ncbi:GNAT family N-acetyltransferase [Flagellimonas pacifica]|uniref:Acetyltransferase (GNAT) family protein n=1 Tax=Flagellimonas pacifica TaxID=1247520 RepID=A0A285MSH0_9FLAO|nr:GNAT family N-acetyltransferase [Allomuricauda parva]SNZ00149.1 Acetyltransferase (GNAT) family protein [Allomuricauda parva]
MTTTTINQFAIKGLGLRSMDKLIHFVKQLNPNKTEELLRNRLSQMLGFDNYQCFGFYKEDKLIGMIGCWTFIKIYSGKQLAIDNVIIDAHLQSKGYGTQLLNLIETWAKNNKYESIELDAYLANNRAHKFYFGRGHKILGFHMYKKLQ